MSIDTAIKTITPEELQRRIDAGGRVDLIDVRTPAEFRELHAESARSAPLDALDPSSVAATRAGGPLYVICRSGSRARRACEQLTGAGLLDVVHVEGGTLAWASEGLPIVRGPKAISLERQVRIASGSLVLLGAALGALVHPGFIGIAAFVGAGLVFAGLSDTCGMGMLLARMPWNR